MGDFVEITDEFGRTRRMTKEEVAAALEEEKRKNKENLKRSEESRRRRSRSRSPGRKGRSRSRSPRRDRDRKYDGHRGGSRSSRFDDRDRFDSRPQHARSSYPPRRDEPGSLGHPHLGGTGGMGMPPPPPFQNGDQGGPPMGPSVGRGRGVNLPAWMTRGQEGPAPGQMPGPMGPPPGPMGGPMGPPPRHMGPPPGPPLHEFGQLQQHPPRQEPYSQHQQRPSMDQQAMQGSRLYSPPLNNGMHQDMLDRPVSQTGSRSLSQPPNVMQPEPQQQHRGPRPPPPRGPQEQGPMPGLAPPAHQQQSGPWPGQNPPLHQHQGGPAHPFETPSQAQVPRPPYPPLHARQMGQGPFPTPSDQQPPFGPNLLPPHPMNQEQHGSRQFPAHNMPPSLANAPPQSLGLGTGSSQGSQSNTSKLDTSRSLSLAAADTRNSYARTTEAAQGPWSQGTPQQGQSVPVKPGSGYAGGTGPGVGQGSFQQGQGNFERGQGKYQQGPGSFEQGHGKYQQGQGSLQQGQGNYQEGQGSFEQGQVKFQQGQGSFQDGQGKLQQGQGSFQQQSATQGSYQHGMSVQLDYGYGVHQQPNTAYGLNSQSVQQTPQPPLPESQTQQMLYASSSSGQTAMSGQSRGQPGTQAQYQQPQQYQQDFQKGQQQYPANVSQGAPAEVGSTISSATTSATSDQLPPGWQAVLDNTSNCYYYWNMHTNETSWETPKPAKPSTSQGVSSAPPPPLSQPGLLPNPTVQAPVYNQSGQFQQSPMQPQSLNQPGLPMQQPGYNTSSASISRQPELYRVEDLRGGQRQQSQPNQGQQGYGQGGFGQSGDQRQVNRSYDGPPASRIDPVELSQQQWHDYNRSRGKGR